MAKSFELQLAFHRLHCEFVKYAQLVQRNDHTPRGDNRCLSPASNELFRVLKGYVEFSEERLRKDCAGTDKCRNDGVFNAAYLCGEPSCEFYSSVGAKTQG